MQTVTLEEARAHFDELVERVCKTGNPETITGPDGALVQIFPVVKPAYYFKGRPVYTSEQLKAMPNSLPDDSEWVRELKQEHGIG